MNSCDDCDILDCPKRGQGLASCIHTLQDICRDCVLYLEKKCAAWKLRKGKIENMGEMIRCPKKVRKGDKPKIQWK